MKKSDKKLGELSAVLNSHNSIVIREAIDALRNEEPFNGAIGLLAQNYNSSDDTKVIAAIENFFNDIKDQSASTEIIAEIKKPWKAKTLNMLVESCWQSGLDYSDYLRDFTDLFLISDYTTSIECMTVIEESVLNSSRKSKDEIIKIINDSPLAFKNEKNNLSLELISILRR